MDSGLGPHWPSTQPLRVQSEEVISQVRQNIQEQNQTEEGVLERDGMVRCRTVWYVWYGMYGTVGYGTDWRLREKPFAQLNANSQESHILKHRMLWQGIV